MTKQEAMAAYNLVPRECVALMYIQVTKPVTHKPKPKLTVVSRD